MKSQIRKFPMERIYSELDWISERKLYAFGMADSNFGMFERDSEITDKIIENKKRFGYPVKLQASYAKNSSQRLFDIGCKFEKNGMSKGITLSFQSMNEEVLKNIGRQNISLSSFSELMDLYNDAGISTYTELILGLPGETVESIVDSLDKLLVLGQHNSIYVHNCEWLPCSIMGQPDYVERYKIKKSVIPLNQPHRDINDIDEVPEYSSIVTSTYSMCENDWKKMNIISATVQGCHHMGILQFFALYLYNEGLSSYKNFYCSFVDYFYTRPESVAGRALHRIEAQLDEVLAQKGTLGLNDERFGGIVWTFEEYLFLCLTYEAQTFYAEVQPFLKGFGIDEDIYTSLMRFQQKMTKQPFTGAFEFDCGYDFFDYFKKIIGGEKAELKAENTTVAVDAKPFGSWAEFAKVVAWFSRKDGNSTHFRQAKSKRSNF